MWIKILTYIISVIIICVSWLMPPPFAVDPSVLQATAILLFAAEWLFGTSIKEFKIDREGLHYSTHDKNIE